MPAALVTGLLTLFVSLLVVMLVVRCVVRDQIKSKTAVVHGTKVEEEGVQELPEAKRKQPTLRGRVWSSSKSWGSWALGYDPQVADVEVEQTPNTNTAML